MSPMFNVLRAALMSTTSHTPLSPATRRKMQEALALARLVEDLKKRRASLEAAS